MLACSLAFFRKALRDFSKPIHPSIHPSILPSIHACIDPPTDPPAQASNEPDAHLGLAQLLVGDAKLAQTEAVDSALAKAEAKAARGRKHPRNTRLLSDLEKGRVRAEAATTVEVLAVVRKLLKEALGHLEEAARGANAFAMFNLGIAHLFGYGTPNSERNPGRSLADWLAFLFIGHVGSE